MIQWCKEKQKDCEASDLLSVSQCSGPDSGVQAPQRVWDMFHCTVGRKHFLYH